MGSRVPLWPSWITPAYAGKSKTVLRRMRSIRDHPRVCGEKDSSQMDGCKRLGSPPRMRGKVQGVCDDLAGMGITPAYAGKSIKRDEFARVEWDHPRVCGEKQTPPIRAASGTGITPAYAGKRPFVSSSQRIKRDHPRVCGEKNQPFRPKLHKKGSPPRMRGKVLLTARCSRSIGITPAYAGKRLSNSFDCIIIGDHPRVCGEKA